MCICHTWMVALRKHHLSLTYAHALNSCWGLKETDTQCLGEAEGTADSNSSTDPLEHTCLFAISESGCSSI